MAEAQNRAWSLIARPGTWWTGADRVAIARETRHARSCGLCARRRAALSPAMASGAHDRSAASETASLSPVDIEAIHRVATDAGRLGEGWYRRLLADGLTDERYVELVAVVAIVSAVDTFRAAAGLDPWDLPAPRLGEPTRRRPAGAKRAQAWMPTLAPDDRTDDDPDLYGDHPGPRRRPGANIQRALSLVPDAMTHWWDVFETMYFTSAEMRDFAREPRAVSHAQMEMLAARVAALNRCEY